MYWPVIRPVDKEITALLQGDICKLPNFCYTSHCLNITLSHYIFAVYFLISHSYTPGIHLKALVSCKLQAGLFPLLKSPGPYPAGGDEVRMFTPHIKAAVNSYVKKVDSVRKFEWYSSQVPLSSSVLCCSPAFKAPPHRGACCAWAGL